MGLVSAMARDLANSGAAVRAVSRCGNNPARVDDARVTRAWVPRRANRWRYHSRDRVPHAQRYARVIAALADGAAHRQPWQLSPRSADYDVPSTRRGAGQERRPHPLLPRTRRENLTASKLNHWESSGLKPARALYSGDVRSLDAKSRTIG